jgi:oligoendopeptidase F
MAETALPELGSLPTWDLSDLYAGRTAPEIGRDIERAAAEAKAFRTRFEGRVAALSGQELGRAIAEYEAMDEVLSRLGSYAQLVYAGDMTDPEIGRFYQSIQEKTNAVGTDLLFFTLEINRIDDAAFAAMLAAPEAAHYAPWLKDVRTFRSHQLSDEAERMLHEKAVAGRSAWMRLFDETMAGLRFPLDGKDVTSAEVLDKLSSKDAALRERAARSLAGVLGKNVKLFALITNTLAKDKAIEDGWRNYARPISARNLANRVEDEVVDALVAAVTSRYDRLSHRYYKLKAGWFGQEQLNFWDRNAPLPEDVDATIRWSEAKDIVLGAYGGFSPKMAGIAAEFFDKSWIDAPVRAGKASGAFSHPTVAGAHPYVLMNFQGKTRDVMTLAHELGHGVHQMLARRQGHLMAETPLTLAETASVFGEMLTFRALLERAADPARRRVMLAQKVEDMLNTVVRQIAFHTFEARVHDKRREGELTPDEIGDIWMGVQTESLGPGIRFEDDYRAYWTYIPHFIHSPFYVYAYAFGDCLVNSLYAVYRGAEKGFQDKYFAMLEAGGTRRHKELLAPFGLDASDPAFWHKGLDVIAGFVDELEAMS